MNDDFSRDLLADTARDELHGNVSEETLARTLAYVKNRRRRSVAIGTTLIVLPASLLLFGLAMVRTSPQAETVARETPVAPARPPRPNTEAPLRELSNRELFAKFPGKKMVIMGSGDTKVFLFMD